MSKYVFKSTCSLPVSYQQSLPAIPTTLDIVSLFGTTFTPATGFAYYYANSRGVSDNGMVKFTRIAEDNISLSSYRYFETDAGRTAFLVDFDAANALYFAEFPDTVPTYSFQETTITDVEYDAVVNDVSLVTFMYEGT